MSGGKIADHGVEPQRRDLRPIGVGAQAEAAWRRQAGMQERREVRRLRADALGVDGGRGGQRNDELIR